MSRSSFSRSGSSRGRDHRAHYLTSLGIQTNPVEQSLKTLLEIDTIDLAKLREVCGKVELPPSLRALIWKIFLGLFPRYVGIWTFIDKEHLEHYQLLKRTNSLLRHKTLDETIRSKDSSPEFAKEVPQTCLEVYRLRQEMKDIDSLLPIAASRPPQPFSDELVSVMSGIFSRVLSQEHDVFWALSKFTSIESSQGAKAERSFALLRSVEPALFTHIEALIGKSNENRAHFEALFFTEKFSSIFNANGIEPVWDKIIVLEADFEVLLFAALLRAIKDSLLGLTTIDAVIKHLRMANFDQRQAYAIISRALDLKPFLDKL